VKDSITATCLGVVEEQILEYLQQSFPKLKQETDSRGMQPGALFGMMKTIISKPLQVFIRIRSPQGLMQNHVPVRLKLLGSSVYERLSRELLLRRGGGSEGPNCGRFH